MRRSKRAMRRVILLSIFDRLKLGYDLELPRETFEGTSIPDHTIDALLAFKSDARLDELRGALARLENGTFGSCIGCKERLTQELLDNDPALRICARCEKDFSHSRHEGISPRVHV